MTKIRKWGALALAVMISAFSLAGCGAESDTVTDSAESSTSTSAESSAAGEDNTTNESAYIIGVITAVDNTQMTIELYESDDAIDYLSDIDAETLNATGETTTVSFSDNTIVESYENGVTTTSTIGTLAVDDLVAVSDDQIINITLTEETNTTSTSMNTTENTTTTDEDASVAAE